MTLKEIANECGISTATVSNILNGKKNVSEETRKRVMSVIERTGYQPNVIAQGLRRKKSRQIGIIAEDISQFTTPGIIEGVMRNCERNGYRTTVINLRLYARWHDTWYHNEKAFRTVLEPALQSMQSMLVDGIIYIAGHARTICVFDEDFSIPAVMAYAYEINPAITSVVLDDTAGACEIVRYLTRKGHRNIGVLAGARENIHTQKRLLGYQQALFEAGILYNPELVSYAGWDKKDGYEHSGDIISKGVTAVYCMADRLAGGLYSWLRDHNLSVGRDISVAGFDNQDIADYFLPGLTTMELPLYELGKKAADILVSQLEGADGQHEREIYIPLKLVERESVLQLA